MRQRILQFALLLAVFMGGQLQAGAQCAMPTGITGLATSCSTATFTWSMVSSAVGYEYYVGTGAPSGPGTATAGTAIAVTGLAPSTIYFLYLRTNCGGTWSSWTSPFTLVTPACPSCTAPAITGGAAACDSIVFITPSSPANYEYVIDNNSSDPTGAGTPTVAGVTGVNGLNPSTVYYIHVRTDCGSGSYSAWTTIMTTTPSCPSCPAPVITGGPVACDSIVFGTASSPLNYEYVIDNSPSDPVGSGTPTIAGVTGIGGLTGSTVYYLHVRAQCGMTFSSWTTIMITTAACPPCPPPTLLATPVACDSVQLQWVGTAPFEYAVDMSPTGPASGTITSATTVTVGGLSPMTVYYAHLRATCGSSMSSWINYIFTTPPCSSCMPPAGITTTPDAHSVQLGWTAVSGATGYEYIVNTSATTPAGAGIAAATNSVVVTGLTSNSPYYVHTRTSCPAGAKSSWSTAQSFTTAVATGVNNVPANEGMLIAYPSPAHDVVTIEYKGTPGTDCKAQLLNIHGAVVQTISITSPVTKLDITSLSNGIYFLKLGDNKLVKITKL